MYYTQKGGSFYEDDYPKCEVIFKTRRFPIIKIDPVALRKTSLTPPKTEKYILEIGGNVEEVFSNGVFEKDRMFKALMQTEFGGVFLDNDKQIHIIINEENEQLVWNTKTGNMLSQILEYQFSNNSIRTTSFVLIPSKNIILMMGGYGCHVDNLPIDISTRLSYNREKDHDGIWKYCLIEHKWTKLNIKFPYSTVGCVLTNDEKYVIITGGQMANDIDYEWTNDIFILDLTSEDYQLRKCKIKCPQSGSCNYSINTVILGGPKDEMLTDGWIKELFKLQQFKHLSLPPTYLIKMISQWYSQPMLHLFYGKPHCKIIAKHYEIKVSTILDFIQ